MILTCPACGTSYVVKDGAIPPQGRQVRCASCKHSWHQDPDPAVADEAPAEDVAVPPVPVAQPVPPPPAEPEAVEQPQQPVADEPAVGAAALTDEPTGEIEEPASFSPPADEVVAPVAVEAPIIDDPSDWNDSAYHDEVAPPRRRGLMILVLLVLFVAALAAAAWFFAPREWMARAGLREAAGDSPLKLMVTSQDRQKLASGNDLVSLSGRVINPTEQTLTVPPLQADLRDGSGKLVYSWTIAPPAPRLPPRGSASFNAAELGVPANATSLTLRWAS